MGSLGKLLKNEREVLLAFAATRLLLCILAWFSFYWFVHGDADAVPGTAPWNLLARSDALWYQDIALFGYRYLPDTEQNVAFFPLFPLAMRGLAAVSRMPVLVAGFLLSNLALLVAAILLRRLVELDHSPPERTGARAVWFLLLCPMSFFHSACYTESFFLVLSIAALLAARRNCWLAAGLAGALLTATRANALVILIPLLLEAACREDRTSRSDSISHSRWWLLLVPVGFISYAMFLHRTFGDAWAFWRAQETFGRLALSAWQALILASHYPLPDGAFLIGAAILGVALVATAFSIPMRWSYRIYALVMLVVCLNTTWYSLPRYLSAIFPFYIVPAVLSSRSEPLFISLVAASAGAFAICLAVFVSGYPII